MFTYLTYFMRKFFNRFHTAGKLVLWQFITDTGGIDGTGNMAAVNGSVTPALYYIQPPVGLILVVNKMLFSMKTDSPDKAAADGFGGAAALTNGIQLIYKIDGVEYDSTQGRLNPANEVVRIKTNLDWRRYDINSLITQTGVADADFVNSELDFIKMGMSAILDGNKGDYIGVRINDNLSVQDIAEFHCLIEGFFDNI